MCEPVIKANVNWLQIKLGKIFQDLSYQQQNCEFTLYLGQIKKVNRKKYGHETWHA